MDPTDQQNGVPVQPAVNESSVIPKDAAASRVRRRNRMITSCLECRRRKLKCDKQSPCTNCDKFSRGCNFLAPALDSVSQKKLNEIKDKMGSLERTLEADIIRQNRKAKKTAKKTSADLPGEGSDSDDIDVPEDEKCLEATPLAAVDAAFEDEGNDDVFDLGFRVGKFRMTDRIGGLSRPKFADELVFTLVRSGRKGTEAEAPLQDNQTDFLQPSHVFIAPGSGLLFGQGSTDDVLDFLPTKAAADALIGYYYDRVHFLARVVHWPSFQLQYGLFWSTILAGFEPSPSLQATIFAVLFSATASISDGEVIQIFQQNQRQILTQFQTATETALSKAHVLRTTKFETLQALVIYLVPLCRGEISRAHSVLVGAAIRLGEMFGLHRDPAQVFGLSPVDAHTRRLVWFQLCFFDFRTAEGQGPRPSIKREDYDTKLPWNVNDTDLLGYSIAEKDGITVEEKEDQWTDTTLSRLRFECTEMHRIIWYDRIRIDKKKTSITHVLGKVESFRSAMQEKYKFLDSSITIQHFAKCLLDVLTCRMHVMILHKYHNSTMTRMPDRLRQLMIASGTKQIETAQLLDLEGSFSQWRWYNTAYQQWHTCFLLLTEVFMFPNRKEADRIWTVVDYVFEPDLSLGRLQKARSIIAAVRDRAGAYRDARKLREPISMQNRLSTKMPSRPRLTGPEIINPIGAHDPSQQTATANTRLQDPPAVVITSDANWTMDSPYSFLASPVYKDTDVSANESSIDAHGLSTDIGSTPPLNAFSPSSGSDLYPPNISTTEGVWQFVPRQNAGEHIMSMEMQGNQTAILEPYVHNTNGNSRPLITQQQGQQHQTASAHNTNGLDPSYLNNVVTNSVPGLNGLDYSSAMNGNVAAYNSTTGSAWQMPRMQPLPQDLPMLDIDWDEWDKLFPFEMNDGQLDVPVC